MVSVCIKHAAAGAIARAKRERHAQAAQEQDAEVRVRYCNIIRRGQYREGSGRVRTSLGEQQRPGRRGQISKVRLERALIAGMGSSALPSAQEIRRLVGLGLRAWHIGNGLVP